MTDEKEKTGEAEKSDSLRYPPDVTAEEIAEAKTYLESYRFGKCLLSCSAYARDFLGEKFPDAVGRFGTDFGDADADISSDGGFEDAMIRAKMYGVRSFIESLGCSHVTKTVLLLHYVRGFSVTECAEAMGIGRATAFRRRKDGIVSAARKLRADKKKI